MRSILEYPEVLRAYAGPQTLLAYAGPQTLLAYAGPQTLLAFDYDGTLAPIVDNPAQARMRPQTQARLAALARRQPCIVITGRSRLDVRPLLEGIPLMELVGNHGLETAGIEPLRFSARVQHWQAHLQTALAGLDGVRIENKKYSLSVHYRQATDPERARQAILTACAPLEGLRRVGGKSVVNLLPAEGAHKGAALLAVHARLGTRRVIFVGDDETDEDVFALPLDDALLGIRVGDSADSLAHYCLRRQEEVDDLLELLMPPA